MALSAVIVGPGRIGRQHAKWLSAAGCELVGFVCASPSHLGQRAAELADVSGQVVPGFASLPELLSAVTPDLATVCTPAEHHAAPALMLIDHGIPTLIEKPLTWSDDLAAAVAEAEAVAALTEERGVLCGVNLQYTLAAAPYFAMVGPQPTPARVSVTLESRGRGAERTPAEVWTELGPHALSLALALVPGAEVESDSVSVRTAPRTARVQCQLRAPHGLVGANIEVGQRLTGDLVRRFGVDEALVDYAGRNNDAGRYRSYLSRGGVEQESVDWVEQSLCGFVAAVQSGADESPLPVALGLANLRVQAQVARWLEAVSD
ncbi:MAG: Gfo/Idh/MocA family oxidoreductase [Armatimonadetes bacterium]|nr:Gfo/Idh/MocA family oxidoreductase [Armatimonadota bacterium]